MRKKRNSHQRATSFDKSQIASEGPRSNLTHHPPTTDPRLPDPTVCRRTSIFALRSVRTLNLR